MFLAEVVDFNKSYDLKGSGIKYREHQTQKQIELLQEEIALLETGTIIIITLIIVLFLIFYPL